MGYGLITHCKIFHKTFVIHFNELHCTNNVEFKKYVSLNGGKYVLSRYDYKIKYDLETPSHQHICKRVTGIQNFNMYNTTLYNTILYEANQLSFKQTHLPNKNIVEYQTKNQGITNKLKLFGNSQLEMF
jgi:hypothetical protein